MRRLDGGRIGDRIGGQTWVGWEVEQGIGMGGSDGRVR